jgi:hypothetical protein
MRTGVALAAFGIVVTAGGAMLAAPAGQGQDRPGQIGQTRVFVENHGRSEAIPIVLQEVTTPTPLSVLVVGTPTVALPPTTVVQVRAVRQAWDYRLLNLPAAGDAAALSAAGADGWEVTGILTAPTSGNVLVLKRPR